ncbi:class I SAM-dependent methyltransferase [Halorarius halobius]|uniref:class I SAM-dependent methyltransferase n=1 Tax=Halorarius halobius TaxID=2962671 RepID=UPI0020CF72BA|nr:methyltransferase domain-containing protein [Halorarius halobius]
MRRFSADYLERTREGLWADTDALAALGLPERASVLDVGCGTGELSRVLARECPGRVVGADRDPALLAHVEVPAVRADAYTLPFPDDSFDLVVCQALLVNLPDPERALREFARVARESVAAIEPDNAAVAVESSVDREADLAREARRRYVDGVGTDVALGSRLDDLFAAAGLRNVRLDRRDHEQRVEPPYSEAELEAAGRKARGDAIRERREEMAGDGETLDALRADWRAMGREVVEQVQAGTYRRREVVPFHVAVGDVSD